MVMVFVMTMVISAPMVPVAITITTASTTSLFFLITFGGLFGLLFLLGLLAFFAPR